MKSRAFRKAKLREILAEIKAAKKQIDDIDDRIIDILVSRKV